MNINTDIVIVGCGVAGLFCALNIPEDKNITIITKADFEESDSFLAQGGICMLKNEADYDSYFSDTMKAGHNKNNPESVELMIRSSREIISDLISYGVRFEHNGDDLAFTREGGHSVNRILFHEDITGKEITSTLLKRVVALPNVTFLTHTTMLDIIEDNCTCRGLVCKHENGDLFTITADATLLATGGLGGLYTHSTNFPHLKGDALGISLKHNIELQDINYVQIHPTTLYSKKPGRRFLISESVRGEGAKLLDKNHERFVNELLPRDILTNEIRKKMSEQKTNHVWLDMSCIGESEILNHFPNIYRHCLEEGYDVTKECIPVVPAQHYFMGGVKVDKNGCTSMKYLYAAGETCCNGVHGANRLASNSLLESLVWAKRAAIHMSENVTHNDSIFDASKYIEKDYSNIESEYKELITNEISKLNNKKEINYAS